MNRRQAIAIGAVAAIGIPAGLLYWNKSKIKEPKEFSADEMSVLSKTTDAIIPETDTPGAKSLGVDLFVAKMIQDCYPAETQKQFKAGLKTFEEKSKTAFSKKVSDLSAAETIEVLKTFPQDETFIDLLRSLTIKGYSSSEYVMTNIQDFEFIPGRYIGCVNLNSENA